MASLGEIVDCAEQEDGSRIDQVGIEQVITNLQSLIQLHEQLRTADTQPLPVQPPTTTVTNNQPQWGLAGVHE